MAYETKGLKGSVGTEILGRGFNPQKSAESHKEVTIKCHGCGITFESYHDLAVHVNENRRTHRKQVKWAAKQLAYNSLSVKSKKGEQQRLPMTEEDRENRENSRRVLSGEQEYANTICPKCMNKNRELLPIEYKESNDAWRINGLLYVLCYRCNKSSFGIKV